MAMHTTRPLPSKPRRCSKCWCSGAAPAVENPLFLFHTCPTDSSCCCQTPVARWQERVLCSHESWVRCIRQLGPLTRLLGPRLSCLWHGTSRVKDAPCKESIKGPRGRLPTNRKSKYETKIKQNEKLSHSLLCKTFCNSAKQNQSLHF